MRTTARWIAQGRIITLVGIIVLTMIGPTGCAAPSAESSEMRHNDQGQGGHSHGRAGGPGVRHYVRDAGDPDWLVKAAEFHGHLGPWVTVGAMIGQDALKRLDTVGQWDIEVICWMPPEKQRPPFSCILDGLQAASGATMGKRNIRFEYDAEVVRAGQLVVHIIRHPQETSPPEEFVYEIADDLAALISAVSPDRLESMSREIAAGEVSRWFRIRSVTTAEAATHSKP